MKVFSAVARMVMLGILMAIAGYAAAQESYPSKPIRFITPYAPGGSTTVVARLVGQKLSENWGQQVMVDNRPGGNTIIGTEALYRSAPDGYTILLAGTPHVVNPSMLPTPYDAIKDFAPVATATSNEVLLVVHPSVPANNLKEFIALAKAKPGQLNYATSSTGGSPHLASELFNIMAGVKTQHIPYKGGGPAVTDLIGGQVQLIFAIPTNVIAHVKSGRLKAIAVSGETRLSSLPQVPTFTESGLPGFSAKTWYGVLAPAGTPKPIINKLSGEIAKILAMPDIKQKLAAQGFEPFISTPEEFAALIKADLAKYAKIIKAANIKAD